MPRQVEALERRPIFLPRAHGSDASKATLKDDGIAARRGLEPGFERPALIGSWLKQLSIEATQTRAAGPRGTFEPRFKRCAVMWRRHVRKCPLPEHCAAGPGLQGIRLLAAHRE